MKARWLILIVLLATWARAFGGTFTTADTSIRVPASATATEAGDTFPSGGSTIHLDARVYIPDGVTAPAPVVIIIHGYGASRRTATVVAVAQDFAEQGYVVLTPTTRGFGDSDGLVTLGGPNEINDLKTIILAMQTGSIGDSPMVVIPVNSSSKFGVTGASYGGGHSFEIVRTHVAGLAAVAPVIGWTDLYQSLSPNNVPKLSYSLGLFAGGFDTRNPNYDDIMFDLAKSILGGHPQDVRTGGPQHNIDWRSVIFDPAELTVPVFVIQGWDDWLFPSEQATSLFQTTTGIPFFKMYLGGIGHPPASSNITTPEALYLRTQAVRWFDHWLKNIDNGITSEPRVTIAPDLTSTWSQSNLVTADTFPLPGTTTSTYFLNGSRLLPTASAGKPPRTIAPNNFPGALRPIQDALGSSASIFIGAIIAVNAAINSSGDILSPNLDVSLDSGANAIKFTSKPLTADMHVVGLPIFHIFVAANQSNAYYYLQLTDVAANGTEQLVTRGAFRDDRANFRNSHAIDFSPFGINYSFQMGHRIRLRVAARDFPFFYPSPLQPTIKIFGNTGHPSNISLPVVP